MNKPFDEFWKSARNRMTALGAVLLSAGEDAERNSCGHEQAQADAHLEPVQTGRATAGINLTPDGRHVCIDLADGELDCRGSGRPKEQWCKTCLASLEYDGNLLPAMTAMVTGFVDKLAKFYSPCPQGDDCAGDGKHNRLFACDHCDFVGCCACMDQHDSAGHESDSTTAREMHT